jgi:hypothetical protein
MSIDLKAIFQNALNAGVDAVKPGGKAAEQWIVQIAEANAKSLLAISTALAKDEISPGTASMLFRQNERTMEAETLALSVIVQATAQAAINAFMNSLRAGLSAALKIAI